MSKKKKCKNEKLEYEHGYLICNAEEEAGNEDYFKEQSTLEEVAKKNANNIKKNNNKEKVHIVKVSRLDIGEKSYIKDDSTIDMNYKEAIKPENIARNYFEEDVVYEEYEEFIEPQENSYEQEAYEWDITRSNELKNRKRINLLKQVKEIIEKNNLICVNEILYSYDNKFGYYKAITSHELKGIVFAKLLKKYKKEIQIKVINEIYSLVKITPSIQIKSDGIRTNKNLVNVINGTYNIETKELLENSPNNHFFYVINAKYRPEKYESIFGKSNFLKFINDITKGDEELKTILKQVVGYCLCDCNNMKKLFILYGSGDTGKSVLLDLVTSLVGEENVSNVELDLLEDKKYIAELFNKKINICQDLPERAIKDTGAIKQLVNDIDKVICRPLYKQPFSFYNKCKIICATNNLPQLENKRYIDNSAFFNRVVIIPFENIIPVEMQDKNLINKLKKERDLVLNWALEGLYELVENNWRFSYCRVSEEYLEKYRQTEFHVEKFIEETINITLQNSDYVFKCDLKKEYQDYCEEEGRNDKNDKGFKQLNEYLIRQYNLRYTKIHRDGQNKYGYIGLRIR